MSYLNRAVNTRVSQTVAYDDRQVKNEAGGFVYLVDNWTYLRRFLILGSEGGSYYVSERDFTKQNLKNVNACIAEDGQRVVRTVVELSNEDACPKPDTLLYTLTLCMANGDLQTRKAAYSAVNEVCNTGYKLLTLADFVNSNKGWGRGTRKAFSEWFTTKSVKDLAFQAAKYQSRNGWAMADVLRLAHPKSESTNVNLVFDWVVNGAGEKMGETVLVTDGSHPLATIAGMEKLKQHFSENTGMKDYTSIIREYRLPRECIPTELLNKKEIQLVLLENTPFTALIRNLGNYSRSGALDANNAAEIAEKIRNGVVKARVHPIAILGALKVYGSGHGVRSTGSNWNVYPQIMDALDEAFYASFKQVEKSDKRFLVGIDSSGSMSGAMVNGMPFLTVQEGAAALSMSILAAATNVTTVWFDTSVGLSDISSRKRLDDAVAYLRQKGGGGTDCALPVKYALDNKVLVDCFILLTDSMTWAGDRHNVDVLKDYRRTINPNARLVNVQMSSNYYSVADQNDPLSLEVVGFDPNVPALINAFAEGKF